MGEYVVIVAVLELMMDLVLLLSFLLSAVLLRRNRRLSRYVLPSAPNADRFDVLAAASRSGPNSVRRHRQSVFSNRNRRGGDRE